MMAPRGKHQLSRCVSCCIEGAGMKHEGCTADARKGCKACALELHQGQLVHVLIGRLCMSPCIEACCMVGA